ncbi:MAG: response regulator [Sphingomonadaceae bacterium]|nr:response regulator [Sphingomonadaceae bacterium]
MMGWVGRGLRRLNLNIVALALGVLLVGLVALTGLSMQRALTQRAQSAAAVTHTWAVLAAIEGVRADAIAANSNPDRRDDYVARFNTRVKRLAALTADNSSQRGRVAALSNFFARPSRQRSDEALSAELNAISAEEQRLLVERTATYEAGVGASQRALVKLIAATLLVVVLSLYTARALWRDRARAAVQEGLQNRLEQQVAERTRALEAANARLIEEARARRATEAQLRHSQKLDALGQLTGGIAHDFNNMLAIVTGGLGLARRRLSRGEVERAATYLDNAEEGARRAADLTQRLLAFARKQPLAPEVTDVNAQIAATSELLQRTMPGSIALACVLAGGLWRAYVDRGAFENAVVNLAINGRDAMPDGGKLTIETANTHLDEAYAADHVDVRAGQYVVICVTDTGTGMAPDIVERAFDPFFTTKEDGKGTGLGLSQVFGFAKQSGGHVKIYSELGEGTTVKLYLPRHTGEAETRRRSLPVATAHARDGETVLVVEDEHRVRELSSDALRELGYTVLTARDGADALDILSEDARIDLLFTDVVMPEMNGPELARRARALRPTIPVLFTTGYAPNAILRNGDLELDAVMLPKPFGIRELADRVRTAIDGVGGREG